MEARRQEVERLHDENAEKARKAQEQHNWQVQEHARLAAEQLAKIQNERKEAEEFAA